jgi:hypothetical protein
VIFIPHKKVPHGKVLPRDRVLLAAKLQCGVWPHGGGDPQMSQLFLSATGRIKTHFNWTNYFEYTTVYTVMYSAWLSHHRGIAAHAQENMTFLACFQRLVWVIIQASLIYVWQLRYTFGVIAVSGSSEGATPPLHRRSATATICEMVGRSRKKKSRSVKTRSYSLAHRAWEGGKECLRTGESGSQTDDGHRMRVGQEARHYSGQGKFKAIRGRSRANSRNSGE